MLERQADGFRLSETKKTTRSNIKAFIFNKINSQVGSLARKELNSWK
jgi:hypothetical protein